MNIGGFVNPSTHLSICGSAVLGNCAKANGAGKSPRPVQESRRTPSGGGRDSTRHNAAARPGNPQIRAMREVRYDLEFVLLEVLPQRSSKQPRPDDCRKVTRWLKTRLLSRETFLSVMD